MKTVVQIADMTSDTIDKNRAPGRARASGRSS